MLLRGTVTSELFNLPLDPVVTEITKICFNSKNKNTIHNIRSLFQKDIISAPHVSYLNNHLSNGNWTKFFSFRNCYNK